LTSTSWLAKVSPLNRLRDDEKFDTLIAKATRA
jgi:hypothetical protein